MDSVEKPYRKLNLSQRLTTALSSENKSWGKSVLILRQDAKLLTGDVLIANAFISYVGPFTKPFRIQLMDKVFKPYLMKEFQACNDDSTIPMSEDPNPLKILTTEAEVAQ